MLKPLTQRLEERMSGPFGGAVMELGIPLPEVPLAAIPTVRIEQASNEQAGTLVGIAISRLSSLRPDSQELKDRLAVVIRQASELLAEADAVVADCRSEQRTTLERRHQVIRAEGRKQLQILNRLEAEFAAATREWNDKREARQERQHDLEEYTERRKHISQFASDSEIAAADGAIKRAKEALRSAIEQDSLAMQDYSAADSAVANATATLEAISSQESRIKSELAGQAFYDPTLGLEATPSV